MENGWLAGRFFPTSDPQKTVKDDAADDGGSPQLKKSSRGVHASEFALQLLWGGKVWQRYL